jgi:phosphoribosyl-AMP cyclohydrolase
MVAHMNEEAYARTLATGHAWFWSRSRGELWEKGATSGNFLVVDTVTLDCDGDAVLLAVSPAGPACHTGARSCFHNPVVAVRAGTGKP